MLRLSATNPRVLWLLPVALATTAAWFAPSPAPERHEPPTLAPLPALPARADTETLLHRFALNALLAPLLDADAPPLRWADPALIPGCGEGTDVRIDGVPLAVGAEVPTGPFTLDWALVDCMPFGNASIALSGPATLRVVRDEHGAQADVHAERLRIDGLPARAELAQPFTAHLAFAPAGTDSL